MFTKIAKDVLPEFIAVMLLSSLLIAAIMAIVFLAMYLAYTFSIVIGLIVGVILFVGGFFLLMILYDYIPAKRKEWKAKRSNDLA